VSQQKKQIRKEFRDAVFERDGHQCCFCSVDENLDAHHITDRNQMPKGGYVVENGITLCEEHHRQAEIFHSSEHQFWPPGFHPNELYVKINSSYEDAYAKSNKL
jgi:hypothetical protein